MSLYVRELLFDSIYHGVPSHEMVDICNGLQQLRDQGHLDDTRLSLLRLYLAGYTLEELSRAFSNPKEELSTIFGLLSGAIEYSDDYILHLGLSRYPKYTKLREALKRQMLSMHLSVQEV